MSKQANISSQVLRWPGSKWRAARAVVDRLPRHATFVEPFGGSAAAILQKKPSAIEIYNDTNNELTLFWRVLRNPEKRADLINAIRNTPYSRADFHQAASGPVTAGVFKVAESAEDQPNFSQGEQCGPAEGEYSYEGEIEALRQFLVRSWMGFGRGGTLFDMRRGERGAMGQAGRWDRLPDSLENAGRRFKNVIIEALEPLKCLRRYDGPETLFFINAPDPDVGDRVDFYGYSDLFALALALQQCEGMVVVLGDTPFYLPMFGQFGWKQARIHREPAWVNPAFLNSQPAATGSLFSTLEHEVAL